MRWTRSATRPAAVAKGFAIGSAAAITALALFFTFKEAVGLEVDQHHRHVGTMIGLFIGGMFPFLFAFD